MNWGFILQNNHFAQICVQVYVETIGHKVPFKSSLTLLQNVTKTLFEVWPFILIL